MRIDILTLFPEMFLGPFDHSIIKRARDNAYVQLRIWDIRNFTYDRHRVVDDVPYGGGPGMIMKPEPVFAAVEAITKGAKTGPRMLLMCPQGQPFSQSLAKELAQETWLLFLCGHYEGVDERVSIGLPFEKVSIGDYVLTGGELPAMVIIDAVARLIPGVLGEPESAEQDSFADGLLEHPHYTRPQEFRGMKVPEVLLSGHHEKIRRWRRRQSLLRTRELRPDLLSQIQLSREDEELLANPVEDEEWG
ncbi:MAG: tRNA (guanosine(37)-N1)-methyltransferase TrmD [Limnochordia bacterium]|nr:tRNA (guanosine(37)-N1)-methyltransferase TrmD [Bacillota bacterium]